MTITDEQILSILNLSNLPEVNSVEVRQVTGRRISVFIHPTVDTDVSPVIEAFKSIVPGVEGQAEEPYEMTHQGEKRVLIQVHRFNCYPAFNVDIYEKKGIKPA